MTPQAAPELRSLSQLRQQAGRPCPAPGCKGEAKVSSSLARICHLTVPVACVRASHWGSHVVPLGISRWRPAIGPRKGMSCGHRRSHRVQDPVLGWRREMSLLARAQYCDVTCPGPTPVSTPRQSWAWGQRSGQAARLQSLHPRCSLWAAILPLHPRNTRFPVLPGAPGCGDHRLSDQGMTSATRCKTRSAIPRQERDL